jgi:hypothetical protein
MHGRHTWHTAARPHPRTQPPPPQALGDTEQGFSEDDYIGLFDEVKFPTSPPSLPNAGGQQLPAPAASPEKTRDASPSEKDGLTLG